MLLFEAISSYMVLKIISQRQRWHTTTTASDILVEIQNYHLSWHYEIINIILHMMIYAYYLKL